MKRLTSLALIGLLLGSNSVMAKCLSDPSVSDECRFPKGDAWCAEQAAGKPYAYSDSCLQKHHTSTGETSAQLLESYQGWWRYPDNADGCDDEDNKYRVALGTYHYNQNLSQVVFGQGATAIGMYDASCELSNGKQHGQVLQFAAKCTLEEGETESGVLRITVHDQNNIAVRFPYSPDYEMRLIRCQN